MPVPRSPSLCVFVCACDTVDNAVVVSVEVVVSHSHPTPHQHCTLHSACPFCSRVVGRALFSHEIPLLFQLLLLLLLFSPYFFFVLSFSCFVHGEFFFLYFICARVCPVRLQLPYPVPVFFFGVSGKGLKTWVRSECPCVCVFVCVRGQSPRLNFHVKRILKHHRFVRFSFRFALLFVRPALNTFHIHSYFHLLTPSLATSFTLLLCGLKSLCGKVFAFYFWSWRVDAKTTWNCFQIYFKFHSTLAST